MDNRRSKQRIKAFYYNDNSYHPPIRKYEIRRILKYAEIHTRIKMFAFKLFHDVNF